MLRSTHRARVALVACLKIAWLTPQSLTSSSASISQESSKRPPPPRNQAQRRAIITFGTHQNPTFSELVEASFKIRDARVNGTDFGAGLAVARPHRTTTSGNST
jgi:hypothetical protein